MDSNRVHCLVEKSDLGVEPRPESLATNMGFLSAPKPGCGVLNLRRGYNQVHQKDFFWQDLGLQLQFTN